jgi:hypothetical protein
VPGKIFAGTGNHCGSWLASDEALQLTSKSPTSRQLKSPRHENCCTLPVLFPINQHLRGATTMHEIPNLPFPSLHETEQSQPSQTAGNEPAFKAETEAEETRSANRQD